MSLFLAEKKSGFHEAVLFLKTGTAGTLIELLQSHPAVGNKAEELILFGSVYLNQIRTKDPTVFVKKDSLIRVHSQPRRYPVALTEDNIVEENDHFILVWKPALLPTHATVDNSVENTLSLLQKLRPEALLLNRLDLETEGFLLFARTPLFQKEFHRLLSARQVEKRYQTLVDGRWDHLGLIQHEMAKSFKSPKQMSHNPLPDSQTCQMNILRNHFLENQTAVEIQLITGRSHQIRAQSAFEGHPLTGDTVYGSPNPYPFKLVCSLLGWESNGRHWEFEAKKEKIIF